MLHQNFTDNTYNVLLLFLCFYVIPLFSEKFSNLSFFEIVTPKVLAHHRAHFLLGLRFNGNHRTPFCSIKCQRSPCCARCIRCPGDIKSSRREPACARTAWRIVTLCLGSQLPVTNAQQNGPFDHSHRPSNLTRSKIELFNSVLVCTNRPVHRRTTVLHWRQDCLDYGFFFVIVRVETAGACLSPFFSSSPPKNDDIESVSTFPLYTCTPQRGVPALGEGSHVGGQGGENYGKRTQARWRRICREGANGLSRKRKVAVH